MAQPRRSSVGVAVATTTEIQHRGDEPRSAFANWRSWLLAVLLIAGVVVAVLHWGDVRNFAELVAHAQPLWLLAGAVAQLLTYVALAIQWALVLRAAHCRAP